MTHVLLLDSLNEDVFVCGICKNVFNSLDFFLEHKRICVEVITVVNSTINAPENHNFDNLNEPILDTHTFSNLNETVLDTHTFSTLNEPLIDTQICADVKQAILDTQAYSDLIDPIPNPGVTEEHYVVEPIVNEPKQLYLCDICKKEFNDRDELTKHINFHYIRQYQCLICGRCSKQNSHLQRHISSHKVWPESLSETIPKGSDVELLSFTCPYCNTVFANYTKFRSHLKTHQSLKKFKCIQSDCTDFKETIEELIEHVSAIHTSPQYTCYICNQKFQSLEIIANHQYDHYYENDKEKYEKKSIKCKLCDAIFRKEETLNLHMQTETHNKICIHCNKTFASDKRLRMHLRIHSKIRTYHCHICESSFHLKKYLTSHLMKHSTVEYKCPNCNYIFKRPDLLKRHMKGHQNNKLKCPFRDSLDCMREFSRTDKLKMHIETHAKREAKAQKVTQEQVAN